MEKTTLYRMKIKKNYFSTDLFIIITLILAIPFGFLLKYIYKKYDEDKEEYVVNFYPYYKVTELDDFNFSNAYNKIKDSISKNDKTAYFSACKLFNIDSNDYIKLNKEVSIQGSIEERLVNKQALLSWCMNSYRYIDSDINDDDISNYYFTMGIADLYGITGNIDYDRALLSFKSSYQYNQRYLTRNIIESIGKINLKYSYLKPSYRLVLINSEIIKDRKK